jgi:hypothetical protein
MIKVRQDLHLGAKAASQHITAHTSLNKFDCDLLPVLFVVARCEVNATHSSVTNFPHYAVCADARTYLFGTIKTGIESEVCCSVRCALFERILIRVDLMLQ